MLFFRFTFQYHTGLSQLGDAYIGWTQCKPHITSHVTQYAIQQNSVCKTAATDKKSKSLRQCMILLQMNVFVCVYVRNSRKINWREKNSYDGFSVDSSTVINNRFYRSFLMLTRHEVYKKGDFDVHTNELIIKFKTDKISHLWHTFIRTYHADYVRNKTTKNSTRAYSTHIILHAFMESAGRHARMPVACLLISCVFLTTKWEPFQSSWMDEPPFECHIRRYNFLSCVIWCFHVHISKIV